MSDTPLTDEELAILRAAGYELAGVDGDPDGTVYVVFYQGDREVRSTPAEWWLVIADLNRPPIEDEIAFGKGAWVYCNQHMRAHQTGWCTVSPMDKVGLGATTAKEAHAKCRAWGFPLYADRVNT